MLQSASEHAGVCGCGSYPVGSTAAEFTLSVPTEHAFVRPSDLTSVSSVQLKRGRRASERLNVLKQYITKLLSKKKETDSFHLLMLSLLSAG